MTPRTINRLPPFHPILFALMPVLSALAGNLDSTTPRSAVRPIILVMMATIVLWVALSRRTKDVSKAAAICSFVLLLFFSYGHFTGWIASQPSLQRVFEGFAGPLLHDVLLPLIFLAFLIAGALAISRMPTWRPEFSSVLNTVGLVAAAFPLYVIASYEAEVRRTWNPPPLSECARASTSSTALTSKPDIYYIILDSYGREDILSDVYGYDNSAFLNFLEQQGFYVAGQSQANYAQTRMSLASALNMQYLGDLLNDRQMTHRELGLSLARMIQQSRIRQILEEQGYTTIAFSTGYRTTELVDADVYMQYPGSVDSIIGLEQLIVETSGLRLFDQTLGVLGLPPIRVGFVAHRQRVGFVFDKLTTEVPGLPGPKFVFAHIISPHPPFVLGPDGTPPSPPLPFSPHDGDKFPGSMEEYRRGYTDQLTYVNARLEEVIPSILTRSPNPPVLILQGDHGPALHLKWEAPERPDLIERAGILNAYYLPVPDSPGLYPEITPVNSFRLMLNAYLGMNHPFLPDRSYFSSWSQPLHFIPMDSAQDPLETDPRMRSGEVRCAQETLP